MKKLLIGSLLIVPLLMTSAYAAPADEYVENYSDEEAQGWYEFSQNTNVSSDSGGSDESQSVEVNRSQRGPVFDEDSESNDNSEVNGVSVLPIVGNDILNDADVLSNVANNYSQRDDSTTTVNQSRSEDNSHTSIIEDSFNEKDKVPLVVLDSKPSRVVRTSEGGSLPTTGYNFYSPLAFGLWLLVTGFLLVRIGRLRSLNLGLSAG